jgi:hypothetical protein
MTLLATLSGKGVHKKMLVAITRSLVACSCLLFLPSDVHGCIAVTIPKIPNPNTENNIVFEICNEIFAAIYIAPR